MTRLTFVICTLILLAPSVVFAAGEITISGDPIDITINNLGGKYVLYNSTMQYFANEPFQTCLFLNGTTIKTEGGNWLDATKFVAVSHETIDTGVVRTIVDAGSDIQLQQTITYVDGAALYKIEWKLTNNSENTFTDCRFIHGGDTYFGGDDSSIGHYEAALGMVYLTNPDPAIDGIMGLMGDPSTPADRYMAGALGDCYTDITAGQLSNTENPEFRDAAYALQWNNASFDPGEVWTIIAYEKWTAAGLVQVFAPSQKTAAPGELLLYQFTVLNFQGVQDTFDLSLNGPAGWTAEFGGPSTITLNATQSGTVDVALTVANDATAGNYALTLTATSQADGDVNNSDRVDTIVEEAESVESTPETTTTTNSTSLVTGGGNCTVVPGATTSAVGFLLTWCLLPLTLLVDFRRRNKPLSR